MRLNKQDTCEAVKEVIASIGLDAEANIFNCYIELMGQYAMH
jgi:hypothetical protein